MRILIFGASGLLGLNLLMEAKSEHTVIGVVNRHFLYNSPCKIFKLDLTEEFAISQILSETKPDCVINCIALANVEICEKEPVLASMLNTDLPWHIANATKLLRIKFLHISTDAVFDGKKGNYSEDDTPNPINNYGSTKLAGENAVSFANPDAIIARVNFFGWSLSGTRSLAEWFFNNFQEGNNIKGYYDVCFCPLLANDLAHILLKMLDSGLNGLYHVVSRNCVSKYEFGVALAQQFGFNKDLISPASVKDSGLKAERSSKMTLCTEKLKKDLGVELPTWTDGIRHFYDLYRQGYPQLLKEFR